LGLIKIETKEKVQSENNLSLAGTKCLALYPWIYIHNNIIP